MQIAFYNGTELNPHSLNVPLYGNRGLLYGDGLFETIKVIKGQPLFLGDHVHRLKNGCRLLGLNFPDACDEPALRKLINQTATTNSRVRLTLWRDSQGYYLPLEDTASWLLTCTSDDDQTNQMYLPGSCTLTHYPENRKAAGSLSNIKSLNGLLYVASARFAQSKGADESLILNANGNIIESTSSNIFILESQQWITPPLSEGCLDGVMRKNLIRLMEKSGIPVIEKEITGEDIFRADEALLTNVIRGIRQVTAIEEKKYGGQSAIAFTRLLNIESGLSK